MRNKHMLLMLACCLIPLAALAGVFLLDISTSSLVFFAMLLLCPALHFLMMRGMMGGHGHHHEPVSAEVNASLAETPEERLPRHSGV